MNFTMKAFFFGPTKRQDIITLANTQFFDDIDAESPLSRVTITPGLDANGNPTTDANNSIDRSEISSSDDWDYIVEKSGPLGPEDE
jgi:hypothetical protein